VDHPGKNTPFADAFAADKPNGTHDSQSVPFQASAKISRKITLIAKWSNVSVAGFVIGFHSKTAS